MDVFLRFPGNNQFAGWKILDGQRVETIDYGPVGADYQTQWVYDSSVPDWFHPALALTVSSPAGQNLIVQAPANKIVVLKDLVLMASLPSTPIDQQQSKKIVLWHRVGSSTWFRLAQFLLYAKAPEARIDLMPYLVSSVEFVLAKDCSLGISVEASNSGLLGAADQIHVFGVAYKSDPHVPLKQFQ